MNTVTVSLAGERYDALASGALWRPADRTLIVADLHLGKAERRARQGYGLLPPYDTEDTLNRLDATVQEMRPRCLVMLGDSFDDLAIVSDLPGDAIDRICRLAAGRRVVWLSGNHDPAPVDLPGEHKDTLSSGACVFRHIASADPGAEVSAHYHPKARFWLRGQSIVRPCFLIDRRRIILPAFGTYTGGLRIDDPVFDRLMEPDAIAVLTGRRAVAIPRARAVV